MSAWAIATTRSLTAPEDFSSTTSGSAVPYSDTASLPVNGGFEEGVLDPWCVYDNTGGAAEVAAGDPVEGNFCRHVVVPAVGANSRDVGLSNPRYVFEAGEKYPSSVQSGPGAVRVLPTIVRDLR